MTWFFLSGHVVDLILVLMVLEFLAMAWWFRRTGQGLGLDESLRVLLAGACVFMALRAALTGSSITVIGFFLVLSLFAHIADIAKRWRRHPAKDDAAS